MQRKLKSVFRRSSRSKESSPTQQSQNNTHYTEASSPRSDRHRVSSDRHGRTSVDSSATGSVYTGRSRPVSSVYGDRLQSQTSASQAAKTDLAPSSDINGGAIANDYKAYLPALSPVNDDHGDEYVNLDDGNRRMTGKSDERYEEDVADRNVARYSTSIDGGSRSPVGTTRGGLSDMAPAPLAVNKKNGQQSSHRKSMIGESNGSALSSIGTGGPVGSFAESKDTTTNIGLSDSTRSATDTAVHEKDSRQNYSLPLRAARAGAGRENNESRILDSGSGKSLGAYGAQETQHGVRHATVDGTAAGEETVLARQLREDGIVDLRNTIDTDGDITWAPAITHEVIKPHQHEIVQHKIYREIHNYEHFHRIQPVMMTEVLPPRHWIPNPMGQGLIEISADELPARTGENRWWSVCEHSSPYALQKTSHKYRTEPEIIEAGTFITEEGFERKETIIIHPPTLADLTGYGGPVQAVHFDHKTGERWMGELTTMDKLHELQQTLDRAPEMNTFNRNGAAESLPKSPSTSIPARKPVSGQVPTVHGARTANDR